MPRVEFEIRQKRSSDCAAVAELSARAFGPGRFARTAYRIREVSQPGADVSDLDLCAWQGESLVGAAHFSQIAIGGATGALLLGPLAIDPDHAGRGCGQSLVSEGLKRAAAAGHRLIVLIGDLTYYQKFGFEISPAGQIELPGPVDPERILVRELQPGSLKQFKGMIALKPA